MDNIKEDHFIWTIRDQEGNFVHGGSISKSGRTKYRYQCYKVFSEFCRGYGSKVSAEKALSRLNTQNFISGFNITFRIDKFNLNESHEENDIPELITLGPGLDLEEGNSIEIFKNIK